MKINTSKLRNIANQIISYRKVNISYGNYLFKLQHEQLQKSLFIFSKYLRDTADAFENNENELLLRLSAIREGEFKTWHTLNINFPALITKKEDPSNLSIYGEYFYKQYKYAHHKKYLYTDFTVSGGKISAEAHTALSIWKDKKFDPNLRVDADIEAAILSADAYARFGNTYVNMTTRAEGQVGAIYAKSEFVLNKKEQVFDAQVGACALKGEASISFNVLGASVILTGEGSIGSAEASLTYRHSNREWEFGSKLGFIAGLGFKIHVNY